MKCCDFPACIGPGIIPVAQPSAPTLYYCSEFHKQEHVGLLANEPERTNT